MMQIKDMYVKPIDRDLKGVIKVEQDDDDNAFQELDEYVVTNELLKHFKDFYDAYCRGLNNPTDKMGVWIKGYYGSGKSHFLKILSYLLENRVVDGREAISFFTQTGKIQDNFLIANIEKAGKVSSDVILFNIDSKSAVNSKVNKDAILDVFLRVFNEHQGFCGSNPFVADLERKLSDCGKFEDFKAEFKKSNGSDWVQVRDELFFIEDDIVASLVAVGMMTEDAARNWFQNTSSKEKYDLSIEAFSSRVKEYCAKKGPNHHIIFLVDEIGQYIGDDTKLMLNLQTVAEDLGSKCRGKAWIVVTSQEDIGSLIDSGENVKVKGDDFSKILARFDTRLSLTSANAANVIKIRLLTKNDTGSQTLKSLYHEKESILKNLIVFSNREGVTVEMKKYADANEFAQVYPFIPYQFDLLRFVLKAIHDHGASGKHLSEGERSMLAMFREAAISVMNKEAGALVSFDLFYQALHTFLDHSHSSVIIGAENNSHLDEFDVKVLKTLFMIKYVKEIHANPENIATLLIDSIDADRLSLEKKVEESLKKLMGETLIQKNGSIYTFLTNEEQDVNRAIEKMDVSSGEVRQYLQDAIFMDSSLLGNLKFAVPTSGHSQFGFNKYLDDTLYKSGSPQELSMYIVTANSPENWTEGNFRTTTQNDNKRLMIHLGGDTDYIKEIYDLKRIRNYLTRNGGAAKGSQLSAIISAKNEEIREREDRIIDKLKKALAYADIYVGGEKLAVQSDNPLERIKKALTKLADLAYLKLDYMTTKPDAAEIHRALRSDQQTSLYSGKDNQRALEEVVTIIHDNSRLSIRTTFKTLSDKLTRIPYGFNKLDVSWLVATLFSQNQITLKMHGEVLTCSPESLGDVEKYLTKNEFADQLILEIREKVSQKQIASVKKVIKEFFGKTPEGDGEDILIRQFSKLADEKIQAIKDELRKYSDEYPYPGRNKLEEAKSLLENTKNDADNSLQSIFFSTMDEKLDDFLDIGDDLNTVLGFFTGGNVVIFNTALKALKSYEEGKTYLIGVPGLADDAEAIRDIVTKDWPYGMISSLPALSQKVNGAISGKLSAKKEEMLNIVLGDKDVVDAEFAKKSGVGEADEMRNRASYAFAALQEKLQNADSFAVVMSILDESSALKSLWLSKAASVLPPGPLPIEPAVSNDAVVSLGMLIAGMKTRMEDEDDIDEFVVALKTKLVKALEGHDSLQVQR